MLSCIKVTGASWRPASTKGDLAQASCAGKKPYVALAHSKHCSQSDTNEWCVGLFASARWNQNRTWLVKLVCLLIVDSISSPSTLFVDSVSGLKSAGASLNYFFSLSARQQCFFWDVLRDCNTRFRVSLSKYQSYSLKRFFTYPHRTESTRNMFWLVSSLNRIERTDVCVLANILLRLYRIPQLNGTIN